MPYVSHDKAEGIDPDRTINYSVFCERCGYNLRYSTYAGRCNECGNPYNARPLVMLGIFSPISIRFPSVDMLLAVFCFGLAFIMIAASFNPFNPRALIVGAISAVFGALYTLYSFRQLRRFFRYQRVLARARSEENE